MSSKKSMDPPVKSEDDKKKTKLQIFHKIAYNTLMNENEFETRYDHIKSDSEIYKLWEDAGYFNPDICIEKGVTAPDAESFSIILPPPNVTGELHMGHAAMLAIEDVMVRYHRMRGKRTLWVPGTDHAAIAAAIADGSYDPSR